MSIKKIITKLFCIFFTINSYCQSFVNGDLDGVVNGPSCLPNNWQNVPYTDVNCLALNLYEDSPDLTNINAPGPLNGTNGNPYSGSTFISGQFGTANNPNHFWQEGIMYCAGCDTEALNCKPITNLKEKTELSNLQ
jgi:hypothetical protein